MTPLTPITIVTGPLGSGKTTLLRQILDSVPRKIAIVMNEFGEIAIDSRVIEGRNVRIAEIAGGCVCCSLTGEFEAAVAEVIAAAAPEIIVVETTGVAEPDAIIINVQESMPEVRLDGIVTVADAEMMIAYPQLGQTTRMQIEAGDLILLNKADLISGGDLEIVESRLREINGTAAIVRTERARIDPDLLFGIARGERTVRPAVHVHQPEYESIAFETGALLGRREFEDLADGLDRNVYRAKGFVRFADGTYLFNYVAGRWEMERFRDEPGTALVLIGRDLRSKEEEIVRALRRCER